MLILKLHDDPEDIAGVRGTRLEASRHLLLFLALATHVNPFFLPSSPTALRS
jgi:hypothetical protein